jgi:hypothetical protein
MNPLWLVSAPDRVWSNFHDGSGHSRARCRRTRQGSAGLKHGSGGNATGDAGNRKCCKSGGSQTLTWETRYRDDNSFNLTAGSRRIVARDISSRLGQIPQRRSSPDYPHSGMGSSSGSPPGPNPCNNIFMRDDLAGIGRADAVIDRGELPFLVRQKIADRLFDNQDFGRSRAAAVAASRSLSAAFRRTLTREARFGLRDDSINLVCTRASAIFRCGGRTPSS